MTRGDGGARNGLGDDAERLAARFREDMAALDDERDDLERRLGTTRDAEDELRSMLGRVREADLDAASPGSAVAARLGDALDERSLALSRAAAEAEDELGARIADNRRRAAEREARYGREARALAARTDTEGDGAKRQVDHL